MSRKQRAASQVNSHQIVGSDDGACVVGPPLMKAEDHHYVGDHGNENAQGLVVVVSAIRPRPV